MKILAGGLNLTLLRMGLFGAAHGTHILRRQKLTKLYLTKRRSKKHINHVTPLLSSADVIIFSLEISNFCYVRKYTWITF